MSDHWKNYAPVDGVIAIDRNGNETRERLQVTAYCTPNLTRTDSRIVLHLGADGSRGLTLEQSAELRERLAQAERDVAIALTCPGKEVGRG